jgi:hypothetical protein
MKVVSDYLHECADPAPAETATVAKSAPAELATDPTPTDSVATADLDPAESTAEPLSSVADYATTGAALTETSYLYNLII